jgi:S-adenosylmethionine:tRNA ribosyltransferase-isomerase
MTLDDFDYALPPGLIAQHPPADRSAGRLLHVDAPAGTLTDRMFRDLPDLVRPGDLLVMNDTRVLEARLMGRKASGGRIEVLIERVLGDHEALAQVRASKSPGAGTHLILDPDLDVEVLGREDEFYRLRFAGDATVVELLARHGRIPLPPYIDRAAAGDDTTRYQTVYARHPGSVAAPTAGLHFDEPMLDRLQDPRGAGREGDAPRGRGDLPACAGRRHLAAPDARGALRDRHDVVEAIAATRAAGGRVLAVGTTSLRALESAAAQARRVAARASGETRLFVTPGYRFRVVDRLLTNFHLPKSTLLMLVSAFGGQDLMRRAYAHAVAQRYRFFSYGDAMLIERATEAGWAD